MTKQHFLDIQSSKWMEGTGPHSEIVLTSRVRMARNLKELPFPCLAEGEQRGKVLKEVNRVLDHKKEFFQLYSRVDLSKLTPLERQLCVEKHIISPQMVKDAKNSCVLLKNDESVSIMINEEDHIRIQSIFPGLQLENAWKQGDDIDNVLEEDLDFAFNDQLGYLTSCPTNVGTGMRASLMMHLPGLAITKQINRILSALYQVGMVVRGLYGEGTEVVGNILQLSNQITLGQTEREIIRNLYGVAKQLLEQEEGARQGLLNECREKLADRAGRAYGILSNARIMSSLEAMQLFSDFRLGVDLGLLKPVDLKVLNQLLVIISPAFIQKNEGKELSDYDIDVSRAGIIREKLAEAVQG
ncbi:protein arginine kinase [Candidatus Contubernalis alkaliaceticus]|uniref:protein arginine kinase n=1 Tax=Candidatus Contubernalis alkaliaceticus TaxID=338645 RepID=UPI001F4C00FC|nr:protein arginine kinase [Candidatus Contubernalis alkalaceticus]UNC93386.1 protein arginine kinase [Candidatus Contubernalis alkalaceticus]